MKNGYLCRTIPIFGANFESCNIFPAEMRFFHALHTPELAFPALSREYGGARCRTIPKNGRKMESCDILRNTERAEAAGSMRPWQEKRIQDSAFHIFDDPALPYQEQEPRIPNTVSIGTIPSTIRERTHRKSLHAQTENTKATSQIA